MNMLSNGKPKSFIEFFNLTHSEPPEDTPQDSETKKEKVLSPEDLSSLSVNLVEAELAGRNVDFEKLSRINFVIANIFETAGHYHKAVFYLLRSLENAKEAGNPFQEANAKLNLGKVNVKIGSCFEAITWFEEYLEFARDSNDTEGLLLGSTQLLKVYDLSAKRARRKGQLRRGLELFLKTVHMAEICDDNRAKAEAKHQIGLIYQKLSESESALQYQMEFLEFCRSENDMATACCKLGMIYNKQHLYDKALLYFDQFFKLACALKDPKLMDAARLNLGFVTNTVNMSDAAFSIQQVC